MSSIPSSADRVALPVRYPDVASKPLMNRRAWWLIVMNFLVPGSAQVLAGSRRLGRFGLAATILSWVIAVVVLVLFLSSRATFITVFTNPITLVVVQIVVAAYALLWIALTIDTLRLTRIVRLGVSARAGVGFITVLLLVGFGGGGAYAFMTAGSARSLVSDIFVASGPAVPPVDGYYNILLLGGDSGEDRDGLRPDSTSVLSVNAATGQAIVYGIPRDLSDAPFVSGSPMAALYPQGYGADGCAVDACEFNSIYTEAELMHPELYPDAVAQGSSPGIEATKEAAEGVLGIPIQYYVLVDMQGFQSVIDALGGVTINVTEELPINGEWEDGEEVAPPDGWIEPGVQQMDGYTALWYARSRYTTSDYDRMDRQHQLEEAIMAQFDPTTVLTKFQQIAGAVPNAVQTDIPQSMLGTFVDLGTKARGQNVTTIELTPPIIDPDNPDYGYILQLVQQSRGITPTSAPTP